jgi:hypothetical protein
VGTKNWYATVEDNGGLWAGWSAIGTWTVVSAPAITTSSPLPNGTVGVAYSQSLSATGGTPPYTWSVISGSLPPGLSLSSGGVLSGTPTTASTYNFTVQVSGGGTTTKAFGLTIGAGLSITNSSPLPNGTVGVGYSQTLSATGGTPPYTWSVISGSLPPGLSLSSGGVLSGTPTTANTYNFTVQVSGGGTASKAFSLTIGAALSIITSSPLPNGTGGTPYSQTLAATGGSPPYTWSVASGLLPSGLTLSSGGLLSGTPATAATYTFGVQATDTASQSATKTFSLTVGGPSIYPSAVGINLSYFPIDRYFESNVDVLNPPPPPETARPLIYGCPTSMTVRQCVQQLFYNPAQPCATADPAVTPSPNNWRSQGVTAVRFFFTMAGGWYSTPFDANGNVDANWSNKLGQFFQDLKCYGIQKVTATPVYDGTMVNCCRDPWDLNDLYCNHKGTANDSRCPVPVESCGRAKTLNFLPSLPYALDPADSNFPDRKSCANPNDSYGSAAQTPDTIFWGWPRLFNLTDTILAKAAATTPTRLELDALDYFNEIKLGGFTVLGRMIHDNARGVNVLQGLRQRMSDRGYDSLRVAPSVPQEAPVQGSGGFDCGSFYGDSAILLQTSALAAALAGPGTKFGEPLFTGKNGLLCLKECDPPGSCDPYDASAMISLPVSYSQPTFIDIHSQAAYWHAGGGCPNGVCEDLDQTAAHAEKLYTGVWNFLDYRNLTGNYIAFGETNPVENSCDPEHWTASQANAMLYGYSGQGGYKNSELFANRPASVLMLPWHRTEGLFNQCTPSPNIINLPFNPNP